MPDLTWTKEKPSKPGMYWTRRANNVPTKTVVGVLEAAGQMWCQMIAITSIYWNEREWAGPIPEPREPGEAKRETSDYNVVLLSCAPRFMTCRKCRMQVVRLTDDDAKRLSADGWRGFEVRNGPAEVECPQCATPPTENGNG